MGRDSAGAARMGRPGKLSAMFTTRPGRPEDDREFVRLRRLMFHDMGAVGGSREWEEAAAAYFRSGLADGSLLAVVVDAPTENCLAATGVATLGAGIPSPGVPTGRKAYISSICTDVSYRRQGLARIIVTELVDLIDQAGIRQIDLHATAEGVPLYKSFGFSERKYPGLRRSVI